MVYQDTHHESQELLTQRKNEARELASLLKLTEDYLHFLQADLSEGSTEPQEDKLLKILKAVTPEAIFLPSPLNPQEAHQESSRILLETVKKDLVLLARLLKETTIYFYDVHSPMTQLYSNLTLDTEEEQKDYQRLLRRFPSQEHLKDYAFWMQRYDGMLYDLASAEVYLKVNFRTFVDLTREHGADFQKKSEKLVAFTHGKDVIASYGSSILWKNMLLRYHDGNLPK